MPKLEGLPRNPEDCLIPPDRHGRGRRAGVGREGWREEKRNQGRRGWNFDQTGRGIEVRPYRHIQVFNQIERAGEDGRGYGRAQLRIHN